MEGDRVKIHDKKDRWKEGEGEGEGERKEIGIRRHLESKKRLFFPALKTTISSYFISFHFNQSHLILCLMSCHLMSYIDGRLEGPDCQEYSTPLGNTFFHMTLSLCYLNY